MRDLTDFFTSSPKTVQKDTSSVSGEDKKSRKTNKNESKIPSTEGSKEVQDGRKKRRKKTKRKSDPAVKNIAELLSNSLCIISPNVSLNDLSESNQQCSEKEEQGNENVKESKLAIQPDENLILEETESVYIISPTDETSQSSVSNIEDDKKEKGCLKPKNKVNAFQFMMESRNKVIGQNSPGKEVSEESKIGKEEKEVLSARKNLLQNWANKKGATKRKREEEEKEEIINRKLQKRAKRMKKLLKVEEPNHDSNDVVVKKTKKRVKRISSSSVEVSKDSVVLLEDSNETSAVVEVVDENAQDKILSESKPKEVKQGLLTFFGVVNKGKKMDRTENEVKITENKGIKHNASKLKKKKSKTDSNMEKPVSESLNSEILDDSSKEGKRKAKKSKVKKHKKRTEESSQENVCKTPKPSKNIKDDGDNFTPRSAKSWKLKIKICDENVEKGLEKENGEQKRPQRSKRVTDYKLLLFDGESSSEGETVSRKKKSTEEIIVCSDEEPSKKKGPPKPLKVAPVFAKATPKPKLAPEVVEARKQFLMSGIPDSLKRVMEKQQSVDEQEYDVFPSISHVQQKCEKPFWNLSRPRLDLNDRSPLKLSKPPDCEGLTNRVANTINIQREVEKVDKLKTLLNKIKSDNPNYPVYKSFRLIYEKSGRTQDKKKDDTPKHKRGRKSRNKDVEIIEVETDPIEHAMWTDKYKPKCSDDIVGNTEGVKNLKKWLNFWKNFSEDINSRKKKKREGDSDSDFDTSDCDSRDSGKLPGNTVVVGGPCGSGKSTAIYALCDELGFNVIELNASSKRTGKRLLQELQEATQSHQVRKKQNSQNFFHSNEPREEKDQKMCVLLIDDVDIVFEQDEGFVSALGQLVSTSKRPVVLTTTDTSPVFVQKFISQYEYIPFLPLSSQSLATWLQIVCLVEGLFVNQSDIGALLEYNKGDARKTLLQLQFWVQSGGQIVRDVSPVKTSTKVTPMEQKIAEDEQEPFLEEEEEKTEEVFVHSDCIKSFEVFKHHKAYRVPYRLNLGLIWWNVPNILGFRSFSEQRLQRFKEEVNKKVEMTAPPKSKKLRPSERRKLETLEKLYDSLAFTDVFFRNVRNFDDLEPVVRNFNSEVKDSLELEETMDGFDGSGDFAHEVTHDLVDGYLEEFSCIENGESVLNIAMPDKAERRWRAKMHVCHDVFLEALPLSTHIERRSVALDYMPYLRNMSRSESHRAANNNKRGNRFRNYLRGLGINYNDNTLKLACNILTDDL